MGSMGRHVFAFFLVNIKVDLDHPFVHDQMGQTELCKTVDFRVCEIYIHIYLNIYAYV